MHNNLLTHLFANLPTSEIIASLKKLTLLIFKYIVPIYILAELLYFYDVLRYIDFIALPITTSLGLPSESALAILSGMFLNLYAAIAFAAPLDLTPREWTILAVFLGICHSMLVENAIIKKLGISLRYSYALRVLGGLVVAFAMTFLPHAWFVEMDLGLPMPERVVYEDLGHLLWSALQGALLLAFQVLALVAILVVLMELLKARMSTVQKNISKGFSLFAGVFLGITYGSGILIKEAPNLTKREIFAMATFLMMFHAVIEDTLLFVIFGANFYLIIAVRFIAALLFALLFVRIYAHFKP